MTQKTIITFINEIYSKPPKKNYATNKSDVYHIDDLWNLDILDYGPENNRNYRYVLVIIDNFSKFGGTVPLKRKCSNNNKLFQKNFAKFKNKTKFNRNGTRKRI